VDSKTAVPAKIRLYDYLLVEDDSKKDFMERFNPHSLEVLDGLVEPHILSAKPGDQFQFLRQGYFCADEKEFSREHIVLNRIVDLKDSFAKAMK